MTQKKKATIYDIAEQLGISTGTVYRALHNKGRISPQTKERVLKTAEELGYQVNQAAQALRRSPIHIGVLLCCPSRQYLEEIQSGIEQEFQDLLQYHVFSHIYILGDCNAEDRKEEILKLLQSFREEQYAGAVLFLSGHNDFASDYINECSKEGMFFAAVANQIPGCNNLISVSADGACAGSLAAEILALGCRGKRISILTGGMDTAIHKANLDGFFRCTGEDVFSSISVYEHGDHEEQILKRIKEMFSENPPDGIYMTSASSGYACRHIQSLQLSYSPMIVTTDLFSDSRELLEEGLITATIYQNPFKQGRLVVRMLYRQICERNAASVERLLIPQAVFRSNVPLFKLRQGENQ